jgi:RNA polymerase sigma-70 factor (ECF subfamily)
MLITPVSLLDKLVDPEAELAWHRFVDIYTPLLYYWAKRMNVPASDVGDLLQEVFVLLLRELPQYRHDKRGHFHGWLHTVFRNKAISWLKKNQRQNTDARLVATHSPEYQLQFDHDEFRHYLTERVLQLMKDQFPESTWKACWASIMEDQPAEKIAENLGMTVNMVYLAKSRVLRQLRTELAGMLD